MRNLKRVLSLMVVLVLCLGLASVASAASYDAHPDADEVSYDEAMDVMVALGIFAGHDSGNLDPTGTLTREQAAKIIAYICLGESSAEALVAYSDPFDDVAADRWSAGYIAYCVSAGIIYGRSDTIFAPEANVTGYEFAKMLLCAIGYGANSEFVGTYWAVNTASYGTLVGLFENSNDTSLSDAITREEAALYAFNALTGTMTVSYSSTLNTYYSGTTILSTIDEEDEYLYTLGYQVYGLYQGDSATDDFGRVGYAWEISGSEISDTYYDDADLVYTGNVDSATLYSDLGSEYAGYATLYIDGDQMDNFPIARNDTADDLGNNSSQIYVYADNDTKDVTIVVINTYLGEITAVDDGEVTVEVYDAGLPTGDEDEIYYGINVSGTYDYETELFGEDDMVLVTVAGGEVQSMEAADSVIGTMDARSTSYLIIDGETYYKSDTYGGLTDSEDNNDYDSQYTFYLDQNDYVIGSELYEEADADYSSYFYITGSEVSVNTLTGTSVQIAVQYLDGTTDVLDLYVTESGNKYYYTLDGNRVEIAESNGQSISDLSNHFFRYSVNSSGYITLRSVDSSSQDAAGWNSVGSDDVISTSTSTRALSVNSSTTLSGADSGDEPSGTVYLNSSTTLHVIDDDGDVTTVTGYDNIKGYSESGAAFLVFYSGSVVSDIYVFGGTWSSTGNYALYIGSYTTSDETYYRFYQDGATVAYPADGTLSLSTRSIYDLDISNGIINSATAEMLYSAAEEVIRSRTDYFTTESGTYYYDDDVVVYDYTNSNAEATLSGGDWVVYALDDGMVAAIYIVSDPADEGDAENTGSDITISNVSFNSNNGNLRFTGTPSGRTVYIEVELFTTGSGYSTLNVTSATLTGNAQRLTDRTYTTAGDYRVTFYADEDMTEVIDTFYITNSYSSGS